MGSSVNNPYARMLEVQKSNGKKMMPDPVNNYLESVGNLVKEGTGPEFMYSIGPTGKIFLETLERQEEKKNG